MGRNLSAADVIAHLGLDTHATCGHVRTSFVSPHMIAAGGLAPPFEAERPAGSALYFLVTPAAPVRLHRIRNDQLYHCYLGDPLEVFLLPEDGPGERVIVGHDIAAGHRLQLLIPGGTFHTARLAAGGDWFLGASTGWPGVIPADVEIGDAEVLAASHPQFVEAIRDIAGIPVEAPVAAPQLRR